MELVQSPGADSVIDYTKEDFTRINNAYDIIFDTFGMSSFSRRKSLKKNGSYLFATYGLSQLLQMVRLKLTSRKKGITPRLEETTEDIMYIRELIENETIKPVLDKIIPFEYANEAHQYVDDGYKKGGVVISIGTPPQD